MARILGKPGIGKTTLIRYFLANLPDDIHVGMISDYSSGLGGLGRWLHWAFALHHDGREDALRAAFAAYLVAQHQEGKRCLLVVDEAQNISESDIGVLTDLTRLPEVSGNSMQLILVGCPEPRNRLHATGVTPGPVPLLIGPMSPEDTGRYIGHRMAIAGRRDEVFDTVSTDRIARLTGGVPRLVNVFCELLLTSAFGLGEHKVGTALVDTVLLEARQTGLLAHLPAGLGPVRAPPPSRTPERIVPPSAGGIFPGDGALPCLSQMERKPQVTEPYPSAVSSDDSPDAATAPETPRVAHDAPAVPITKAHGRGRNRRTGLLLSTAGGAAAVLTFALVPERTSAPLLGSTAWQWKDTSTAAQPMPVGPGPALPAPATGQGNDAASLHDQALIVGAQNPLGAAVGFARAALRGDARAAYYLGQLFEVGDGVPRSTGLAAAWYESASKTQRSARRAFQSLSETAGAIGQTASASPFPLMGITGQDGQAEFVWAASDNAPTSYLLELADGPDAPVQHYGPFVLSAALLVLSKPARVWRIVSLTPDGVRIGVSRWHLIATEEARAVTAVPAGTPP